MLRQNIFEDATIDTMYQQAHQHAEQNTAMTR